MLIAATLGLTLAGLFAILASARALEGPRPTPDDTHTASHDRWVAPLIFALCLASVVHAHRKKAQAAREREESDHH